ncbi:Receptor homology region, transmembrane domain- and RING domain-containing protein 2 [Smittium culicis]|uniref:RING-type E3 ubiquitin transferase n=1 Tax=Smittium culicis TaxID=133412 RepID=A0A1R1Y231_9FUNG|nr:Receptor homology region, transmembrane domain- and RING domain-containing protein 2 [Smittium culicis]
MSSVTFNSITTELATSFARSTSEPSVYESSYNAFSSQPNNIYSTTAQSFTRTPFFPPNQFGSSIFVVLVVYKFKRRNNSQAVIDPQHFPTRTPKKKRNMSLEELEAYQIVPFSLDMVKNKHFLVMSNDENDTGAKGNKSTPNDNEKEFTSVDIKSTVDQTEDDSGDYDCLICFEPIEEGDKIRSIPCEHIFHQHCLDTWLTTRSGFCPTCRFNLRTSKDSDGEEEESDRELGTEMVQIVTVANLYPPNSLAPNPISTIIPNPTSSVLPSHVGSPASNPSNTRNNNNNTRANNNSDLNQ